MLANYACHLIFVGVVAVLFVAGWWFSSAQVGRRALKKVRPTRVRDAREGERVKVVGDAKPSGETLSAPLSGRPCVAWQLRVWVEERRTGDLVNESQVREFYVDDETGRALVRTSAAKLALEEDGEGGMGTFQAASPELEAFCKARGIDTKSWVGLERELRYREAVVEVGETVAVMGVARWEVDPGSIAKEGYRDGEKRLVVEAPRDGAVVISDIPDARS